MADIFISYKREDQEHARQLADALEGQGWTVWWESKLRTGERFGDVIDAALKAANCVIVIWSEHSVNSNDVKDEATYALNRNKLVPLAIEDVDLPVRFEGIHTPQLYDWDGFTSDVIFKNLVSDIAGILGPPPLSAVEKQCNAAGQTEQSANSDPPSKASQPDYPPPTVPPPGSALARKRIFARGVAAIGAIFVSVAILSMYRQLTAPSIPLKEGAWSKDELMEKGAEVYVHFCAACHQTNGQGYPPAFPALAGSEIANGNTTAHIDIVLNGKDGTGMIAHRDILADEDLAAVITYVRNAWGNSGSIVHPDTIASARN